MADSARLTLPISGVELEAEGPRYRLRRPHEPRPVEPEDWDSLEPDELRGLAEAAPSARSQAATWWVLVGPGQADAVEVRLADGTTPEVTGCGDVWVAEWRSAAQAATVHRPGVPSMTVFDRRAH